MATLSLILHIYFALALGVAFNQLAIVISGSRKARRSLGPGLAMFGLAMFMVVLINIVDRPF